MLLKSFCIEMFKSIADPKHTQCYLWVCTMMKMSTMDQKYYQALICKQSQRLKTADVVCYGLNSVVLVGESC